MTTKIIKACTDAVLPDDARSEATERAVVENPENVPMMRADPARAVDVDHPAFIAIIPGKRWKPGRTLKVRFLDGDPVVQRRVEEVAQTWTQHANIAFDFGAHADAEIRISFKPTGSWSYMGTDALGIDKNKATMNYGWLKPSSSQAEYDRVVLHEFGHALGCIHEHNSPVHPIPWDEEAVFKYYMGPPNNWDREKVKFNVLKRYSRSMTQFTEFDPKSIMLYPVPEALTLGDFAIPWRNATLSAMDKAFIAGQYPFPKQGPVELVQGAPAVKAEIGAPGETDTFAFRVTAPGDYVLETSGTTNVFMGVFGPDSETTLVAQDDDSGLFFNARIGAKLQPGDYIVRVRHARPTRTGKYGIQWRKKGE